MNGTIGSFSEIAAFAHEVAQDAGSQALQWFRRPIDVSVKADESPVTEADRQVEEAIRARIAGRFPEHSIFGEEYGIKGSFDAPTWVIDPIDGTRSFISGSPLWGTLIALSDNQSSQLGVIEMPALKESWTAAAAAGSWFNASDGTRAPCRTSDRSKLSEAIFYTTSPFYFSDDEREPILEISQSTAMCRFGGDCYNYGLLASGHVDLVIESKLEPYDFMALVPVIEEAGGVITDWEGKRLTLASGKRVIAASNAALHEEALLLLSR
ncbi:histidinol-phosphatase [Oryzicola mucosus]|uniref:Histidinol-phosphatase n=1 Tax=Oryzicola mucosus TaxID=2767425 RepID=A0A8J6PRK1_9HYPH|nr:histidinol-phosphatase [Oryzicola mucosus]MBD0416955.1 histidinol-phosphatase [Oryzicola mucosus]